MENEQVLVLEDSYVGAKQEARIVLPPMPSAKQNVFAEAMLESTSTRQKRNPLKWAVSLAAHVTVLILLLAMPLYFSQGLSLQGLNATLLVAPISPLAPPPPPLPPSAVPRSARSVPKTFTPGKLTAPSFVPKAVASVPDSAPPEGAFAGMPGGVPGGIPGGQIGGILGGVAGGVAAPSAPAEAPAGPKSPVRVGGDVRPPRLLSGPAPVYPILARQAHVQGMVIIDAIIDEHGNVIEEKVVSGQPLLIDAALKAVSQRKYEPTVLDGHPTPIDLRVEVNFHEG